MTPEVVEVYLQPLMVQSQKHMIESVKGIYDWGCITETC